MDGELGRKRSRNGKGKPDFQEAIIGADLRKKVGGTVKQTKTEKPAGERNSINNGWAITRVLISALKSLSTKRH